MTEPALNIVELGEYVKRKRLEEKLSLRQVATNISVSASTLSRIENGIGVPDSATLARLAAGLGIPPERLVAGGGAGHPAGAADARLAVRDRRGRHRGLHRAGDLLPDRIHAEHRRSPPQ